jgi:hypothetical protein
MESFEKCLLNEALRCAQEPRADADRALEARQIAEEGE